MSMVMISESQRVAFLFLVLVAGDEGSECFLKSFLKRTQKSSVFTKISATLYEKSGAAHNVVLCWLSTLIQQKVVHFSILFYHFLLSLSRPQVFEKLYNL